jgi:hypothetical protein
LMQVMHISNITAIIEPEMPINTLAANWRRFSNYRISFTSCLLSKNTTVDNYRDRMCEKY